MVSDNPALRLTLFQDGSAKAESLSLYHPTTKQLIPSILHISPNGACFLVEYFTSHCNVGRVDHAMTGTWSSGRYAHSDGSSSFCWDNSMGAIFSVRKSAYHPKESRRHLTAAVTSDLKKDVIKLLAFRNTYAERPYLHASLLEEAQLMQSLQVGTIMRLFCALCWGTHAFPNL